MQQALGVPVVQYDDGSRPSMHDLTILRSDSVRAAAEVTGAVDRAATELWNIAYRDGRWIEESLTGGWSVHIDPEAPRPRGRNLRRDLPRLLRALENAGVVSYPAFEAAHVKRLAKELGVTDARQGDTDYPGSIYVTPEPKADEWSGMVADTTNAVAEWIGEFLSHDERRDVRRKLTLSEAEERHAFVIVSTSPGVPFAVTDALTRNDIPPPTITPQLPPEITDVWVVSAWADGIGFRWSPQDGWQAFAKTTPQTIE